MITILALFKNQRKGLVWRRNFINFDRMDCKAIAFDVKKSDILATYLNSFFKALNLQSLNFLQLIQIE